MQPLDELRRRERNSAHLASAQRWIRTEVNRLSSAYPSFDVACPSELAHRSLSVMPLILVQFLRDTQFRRAELDSACSATTKMRRSVNQDETRQQRWNAERA